MSRPSAGKVKSRFLSILEPVFLEIMPKSQDIFEDYTVVKGFTFLLVFIWFIYLSLISDSLVIIIVLLFRLVSLYYLTTKIVFVRTSGASEQSWKLGQL